MNCVTVWTALACSLLPFGTPDAARAHPADSPDVDVRIQIDDSAVRVQMIMNLAFVDEVIETTREADQSVHPLEYPEMHAGLLELYRRENRVTIDGVEVAPVEDEAMFEVDTGDLRMLPLFPRLGMKALIRVRMVLDYPVKAPPQRVAFVWGPYPPDYVLETPDGAPPIDVQAHLLAYGNDQVVTFLESEPEFIWHRPDVTVEDRFIPVPSMPERATLELPGASLGLIGGWLALVGVQLLRHGRRAIRGMWMSAPIALAVAVVLYGSWPVVVPDPRGPRVVLPDETQAIAAFRPLHANIYRAFDYTKESDIYDALARSVDGELLDAMYDRIYRGLIMQEEGGAVSRVQRVDVLSAEVESIGVLDGEVPSFVVRAAWQVEGAVFHWGHSHYRTNEYRARYTVAAADDGWRIRGHEPIEQRRLETEQPKPGERNF